MFEYVKNKEIDYSLWDTCIQNSLNGNIYALSWYLDIISPGWDAIIKKEDGYVSIFPVTIIPKWQLKYLNQPIFAQQLGIFFIEKHKPSNQDYTQILSIIDKKFDLITNYNFNIENEVLENVSGFQIERMKTYHLDISKSYEEIKENYKKDKKYRISQTVKSDLEIYPSLNIYGLIGMFNEYTAHKIPGVKDNPEIYHTLKDLFREATYHKMTRLFEVRNAQKESIAMALFLIFKKDIIYFFSAISPEGKKKNAIIFLVDFIIKTYSERDLILDFEGSHVQGIADFYSSFGAEKKEFMSISKNNLPQVVQVIKKLKSIL